MNKVLYKEFDEKDIGVQLVQNKFLQTKAFEDIMKFYMILSKKSTKNKKVLNEQKTKIDELEIKVGYSQISNLKKQKDEVEKEVIKQLDQTDKLERNLVTLTENFNDQVERCNEEKNLRKNIEEQCLGFQKEKDDLYLKNEKQNAQINHLELNCETLKDDNEKLQTDKTKLEDDNNSLMDCVNRANQVAVDKMNEINDLNDQLNKKLKVFLFILLLTKDFNLEKKNFEQQKNQFDNKSKQNEMKFQTSKESSSQQQNQLTGNFTQDFFEIPNLQFSNQGKNDFPDTLIKVQFILYIYIKIFRLKLNIIKMKFMKSVQIQVNFFSLKLIKDGAIVATCGGDKIVRLFDSASQQQKLSIATQSRDQIYTCVSLSHYSDFLLAGGTDHTASLISVINGKCKHQLTGHSSKINSVGFLNKDLCVTGSSDRSLKFWDIVKGYQTKSYGCESQVSSLDTFNCEPLIVTGHNDGSLRIYSNRDGKVLNIMKNVFDNQVTCVKLSNNNNLIVASSKEGTYLKCYDIRNNRLLYTLSDDNYMNSHEYTKICFGPDDKTIISGNWDSSILIWNVEGGKRKQILSAGKDGTIICTFYHPISGHLYAGDSRGNLYIYH